MKDDYPTNSHVLFELGSDQFQIYPAISTGIFHHTVWRTWLFIAYAERRWLYYQFSVPHIIHWFGECTFWTREWKGVRTNVLPQILKKMTDPVFGEALRQRIWDNQTFSNFTHYGDFYTGVVDQGTSHMSVIAPNGDSVSATTTINL